MDKEVVQIGFPKVDALLENQNISIVAQQDTFVSFNTITPIELVDFKSWKNTLTSMPIGAKTTTTTTNIQQEIIDSINVFGCMNKTPVEALLFIDELKTKIIHGNL
jgi:hypothetical protein